MPITSPFTAELIASAITANCAQYLDGRIDREQWDAEQNRLWKMAERSKTLAHRVKMLLCPKFLPVPPFVIRKQLRDATLKVGR
jgi:hypothetical protein